MQKSKTAIRDMEDEAKAAWRRSDGDESLGDKVADTGDRLRHGIENVGDELHKDVDDASRRVAHERGRSDELNHEVDPGAR